MTTFNDRKAILTTDSRRREMVRQFIESGTPAAFGHECVDLAFAAVDKAVESVMSVCGHTPNAGVRIQALIMAMRVAATEFALQAETYEQAGRDFAKEMNLSSGTIMCREPGQQGGDS